MYMKKVSLTAQYVLYTHIHTLHFNPSTIATEKTVINSTKAIRLIDFMGMEIHVCTPKREIINFPGKKKKFPLNVRQLTPFSWILLERGGRARGERGGGEGEREREREVEREIEIETERGREEERERDNTSREATHNQWFNSVLECRSECTA